MSSIKFNTIHQKLTALGNIFHSILNYKLMRPVSNLLLPEEHKQAKTANSRKKMRKVSKAIKNKLFTKYFSVIK